MTNYNLNLSLNYTKKVTPDTGLMSSLCVLLELQFAPLNNELGDWFQFLSQRHRAAGIVLPILKTAAENRADYNKQSSPPNNKLTLKKTSLEGFWCNQSILLNLSTLHVTLKYTVVIKHC